MKFQLRDYQSEAHAAVFDALMEGYESLLITAATGTGKTVLFAAIIDTFISVYNYNVLVLAPRRELIKQAYMKIRDTCELREPEIDVEMGSSKFDRNARVVVGSIQTCSKENRLQGWEPQVTIIDEAHFALANSYKTLKERFPDALYIGLTATAMRGDKQPVFHENIDGTLTRVESKDGSSSRDSRLIECGFHKHIFDYPLETAVDEGWLVEPRGYSVKSGVDISNVRSITGTDGERDFSAADLNRALEPSDKVIVDRINKAIGRWKNVASDRPTVVFCPSVKYAHWAADLWRKAGYTAAAIDAKTEEYVRDRHIEEIRLGNVQVTCNYGIYTHGTDVDKWSCIVLLRPTESQGLLSQMLGRVTRPLNAIGHQLNNIDDNVGRRELIGNSCKPDSIVIDVVDIVGKHKIATLSTALGLPAQIDLQGRTVREAKKLVREFEEVKEKVLYDCPATYEELEARLVEVRILNDSRAKTSMVWKVREDGNYQYGKAPPGYSASLMKQGQDWRLVVSHGGETILDKTGTGRNFAKTYFDHAATHVARAISKHKAEHPIVRNTLEELSSKQLYILRVNNHSKEEISHMTLGYAKKLIGEYQARWREQMKTA